MPAADALSRPAVSMDGLPPAVLQPLVGRAGARDVVILGTVARMAFLPTKVMELLDRNRIGFDPMDTGAACRSFNVLVTEDRRAAAVLLPV